MVLPPGVLSRWSPVHGSLHEPKIGLTVLAGPVALPPVLPVHIDLVVETVVDRDLRPAGIVDPVHVLAELRAVTVSVSVVLCHEQERVDHFMKEGLHQVFSWSKLQQGLAESDRTETPSALIGAHTSTQCHPWAPLNLDTVEFPPKEDIVELQEHGSDVGIGVQRLPGRVHDGQRPLGLGSRLPVGNNISATSSYLHFPFLTTVSEAIVLNAV